MGVDPLFHFHGSGDPEVGQYTQCPYPLPLWERIKVRGIYSRVLKASAGGSDVILNVEKDIGVVQLIANC